MMGSKSDDDGVGNLAVLRDFCVVVLMVGRSAGKWEALLVDVKAAWMVAKKEDNLVNVRDY